MNNANLKSKIIKELDAFDASALEEFYGVLLNFVHQKTEHEDWNQLTLQEQQGIYQALHELDEGKGIPHEKVMKNIRKKYLK